jgi:hypothetical protein
MTASLGIRVIRSSLADWRSMKKECRHARHNCIHVYSVHCVRGGMGHRRGGWPQKDKHLPQKSPVTGKFYCMTTFWFGVYIVNKSMSLWLTSFHSPLKSLGFCAFWQYAGDAPVLFSIIALILKKA